MIKLGELYKLQQLQQLLKDFVPRIDGDIDEIYKDIEGEHEGDTRGGTESHINCYGYLQEMRGALSFDGFQQSPTKASMILHVRGVLNILGHGYSRERSF